jgi:hypothetical protein
MLGFPPNNSKRCKKVSRSTKIKSPSRGKSTSLVEVQDISKNGIWLYVKGREYFLPYEEFPWFREATVSQIHNVQLFHDLHLNWPDLDVDLEVESLEHPGEYPLIYK